MVHPNVHIFRGEDAPPEEGRLILGPPVHLVAAAQAAEARKVLLPDVLLQALVVAGAKTPDGSLIEAVTPAWSLFVRMMLEDPAVMYQIDPRKLEELIAGEYKRAGYEVTLTPQSGDFGRDVIAEKPGWWSVRILDQVKAYKPKHLVTADDVRALLGVLTADHRASKGVVTTTSDFAPKIAEDALLKPHFPTRLELVNGEQLRARLRDFTAGR